MGGGCKKKIGLGKFLLFRLKGERIMFHQYTTKDRCAGTTTGDVTVDHVLQRETLFEMILSHVDMHSLFRRNTLPRSIEDVDIKTVHYIYALIVADIIFGNVGTCSVFVDIIKILRKCATKNLTMDDISILLFELDDNVIETVFAPHEHQTLNIITRICNVNIVSYELQLVIGTRWLDAIPDPSIFIVMEEPHSIRIVSPLELIHADKETKYYFIRCDSVEFASRARLLVFKALRCTIPIIIDDIWLLPYDGRLGDNHIQSIIRDALFDQWGLSTKDLCPCGYEFKPRDTRTPHYEYGTAISLMCYCACPDEIDEDGNEWKDVEDDDYMRLYRLLAPDLSNPRMSDLKGFRVYVPDAHEICVSAINTITTNDPCIIVRTDVFTKDHIIPPDNSILYKHRQRVLSFAISATDMFIVDYSKNNVLCISYCFDELDFKVNIILFDALPDLILKSEICLFYTF